jgi:hypothetical protein
MFNEKPGKWCSLLTLLPTGCSTFYSILHMINKIMPKILRIWRLLQPIYQKLYFAFTNNKQVLWPMMYCKYFTFNTHVVHVFHIYHYRYVEWMGKFMLSSRFCKMGDYVQIPIRCGMHPSISYILLRHFVLLIVHET